MAAEPEPFGEERLGAQLRVLRPHEQAYCEVTESGDVRLSINLGFRWGFVDLSPGHAAWLGNQLLCDALRANGSAGSAQMSTDATGRHDG